MKTKKCSCRCDCNCTSFGKGKYEISACIESLGKDVVLLISGGDVPHAGCVVTCEPDKATGKVSTSLHNFSTHREEVVARPIAEAVCSKTKRKVICICGIHINHATKKDISTLVKNTRELGRRIVKCF